jgi:outer membrane receptor protein involved in Fe transport
MGGGEFFVQSDLRYMGERSSVIGEPADPLLLLEAYTLLGFRSGVTLSNDSLSIVLFVKNATDEIIQSVASGRFGVSGNVVVNTAPPLTAGLTIRKSF